METSGRRWLLCALAMAVLLGQFSPVRAAEQPPGVTYVNVPGRPFSAISSLDGQWVFVSFMGSPRGGIALLHLARGQWALDHTISDGDGGGLALTHDGKILVNAALDNVVFFDVAKLIAGDANPSIGSFSDGNGAESIYAAVTPDDRFAFISDEFADTVTVVNLDTVRHEGASQAAVVGTIDVGVYPVGLVFSPDGRYLYNTSEKAPISYGWQLGPLMVIDVHKAEVDPAHAIIARIPVGDCPVRVALSPDGETAYVTARNTNTVNVFSTQRFLTNPSRSQIASVPVGAAPVGVIVVAGGSRLVVANSNRFNAPNEDQTLTVIDATNISAGAGAVLLTLPAGAFPRELSVTPDGKTLIVTNFDSGTVEFVDLSHLPAGSNSGR